MMMVVMMTSDDDGDDDDDDNDDDDADCTCVTPRVRKLNSTRSRLEGWGYDSTLSRRITFARWVHSSLRLRNQHLQVTV